MEENGPQSSFMFLVICNESFGYTHSQTLDSSFILLLGMLQEHGYLINRRAKDFHTNDTSEKKEEDGEWVEMIDFDTGQKKRVQKRRSL
jgi:hypothetical protein